MTENILHDDALDNSPSRVPAAPREVWLDYHDPAQQQPAWTNRPLLDWARGTLARSDALVTCDEVERLGELLAEVVAGRRRILQCGDCVEDPAEATAAHVGDRVRLIDELAARMTAGSGLPVVRVGRMAGQLAKPRSAAVERVNGLELPVFRGAMVNQPGPTREERAADPVRLFGGYRMSRTVMTHLGNLRRRPDRWSEDAVWTSHEALLLDYEVPMLRGTESGGTLLTSTHWPWIGERTRRHDGAHVQILAAVENPVACKIGPGVSPADLLALCAVLDPRRQPGRLTLVTRLGADRVPEVLPPLVRAVRRAGYPVIWLCDPLHGNTIRSPGGRKTRVLADVVREVEHFQHFVLTERGVPGGLHLETTPNPVTECVVTAGTEPAGPYTTLCDPRLNAIQAIDVLSAWHA